MSYQFPGDSGIFGKNHGRPLRPGRPPDSAYQTPSRFNESTPLVNRGRQNPGREARQENGRQGESFFEAEEGYQKEQDAG